MIKNYYRPLTFNEYRLFILQYYPNIHNARKFVQEHFIHKKLFYFYSVKKNNSLSNIKYLELNFQTSNFMHLCGLKYYETPCEQCKCCHFCSKCKYIFTYNYHNGSAGRFWNNLRTKSDSKYPKLHLNQLFIKKDGTSIQKLKIINGLKNLESANKLYITNGQTLSYHFKYPKSLVTHYKNHIFELALNNTNKDKNYFYPESLLNYSKPKFKKSHRKLFPVLAIICADPNSGKTYIVSKKNDWPWISFVQDFNNNLKKLK